MYAILTVDACTSYRWHRLAIEGNVSPGRSLPALTSSMTASAIRM